ncbi:MAG: DUF1579 family protein [Aureibaculum sp.]|nr:DUF1579 family protein [Aureibaculum sp.]
MLGYMPTLNNEVLNDRFDRIEYLIGDFTLVVYSAFRESLGWVKSGEGSSSVIYENSFITENVEMIKNNNKITMHNTLAYNLEKDTFKLLTLGNNTGEMDVFNGVISDKVLTFCSIQPEMKMDKEDDETLCIKLIYKRISEIENELIVGSSKDKGKTWQPFLKTVYKRKNTI